MDKRKHSAPPVAAALISILALAVYLRTLAPTITFRHNGADSGDLVTAAINLGVPHPTGYPLYTLVAHLFTRLPGEPARNVNLFSALCAASAVAMVFWAAQHLVRTREGEGLPAWMAAFSAAGILAFGQLLWSQATIAEVYSLNALWAATWLALAVRILPRPRDSQVMPSAAVGRRGFEPAGPYLLTFLFGLGLAHHVTAIWLLPALWPYAVAVRRWLTPRRVGLLLLCLLPGLLAYLIIPLRARVHPVPNWGLARDWSGLAWLVSGQAYRRYVGGVAAAHILQRFAAWAGIWVRDLGVAGLALALLGVWRGLERDRRFTAFGLSYVLLLSVCSALYVTGDSYLYLLPAAAVASLWMAWGAAVVWRELAVVVGGFGRRRTLERALMVVLLMLPALSVASHYGEMDLSADREAYALAESLLQAAAPDAILLSRGDRQTFALWYLRYGLRYRPDVVIVDRHLLAFAWYRADLAARNAELAPLRDAGTDEEAALLLLAIAKPEAGAGNTCRDEGAPSTCRPLQLAYRDDLLLGHGDWTQEGPLYALVR